MAVFLLAAHHDDNSPFNRLDDHTQVWADLVALDKDMRASGVLIFSRGLTHPDAAATVRMSPSGTSRREDGPYESHEHWLSGMWLIEVADRDAALEWAHRAASAHRCDVEVRPFQGQVTSDGVSA